MPTTLSRSAYADQLEAAVRDAHVCGDVVPCAECQAQLDEVRAARRDALIHAVSLVRPRRAFP